MQVYGSIIPGAATLARLLPAAASEARDPRPASREAKKRLAVVHWYEEHGKNASPSREGHFGYSRSTIYDWLKRHKEGGARGLEERSRKPRRVRQPTWSAELEAKVLQLRQENPRWGKDMLTPILRREGTDVSVSMVGRILSRLKQQGRLLPATLDDPCIVRRPQIRPYAMRKPKEYLVQAPGDLVQVDTADVRWGGSAMVYKHFAARDFVSRWDVLDPSPEGPPPTTRPTSSMSSWHACPSRCGPSRSTAVPSSGPSSRQPARRRTFGSSSCRRARPSSMAG